MNKADLERVVREALPPSVRVETWQVAHNVARAVALAVLDEAFDVASESVEADAGIARMIAWAHNTRRELEKP